VLNKDIASDCALSESVRGFFQSLVNSHMTPMSASARVDFLACNGIQADEAEQIGKSLQSAISVLVFQSI